MVGFFLGHMGYYYSLVNYRSSLIQIVLITYCLPLVLVTLVSPIIFKDKINLGIILGLILTLIGIVLTVICNPNYKINY